MTPLQLTRRGVAAALPFVATPVFAQARKPLKILILGGTGFTGPHQVRYALARGHQVSVFNRGRRKNEFSGRVEELTGDRNTGDLKSLEGKTWDVVIDNPTTFPMWVRDAGQVLKGKVGQYVFISSISVYAKNDRPGDDETAAVHKYAGADAYAEKTIGPLYGPLKAFSEQEAARQFGADKVTVIRPGLIVGPGDESDRFTYWPQRLARGGEVLAPGDGTDPVQIIDARDIAEWTVRMVEQRRTGVFNATGPARPLTMKAMLDGIGTGVQAKPPLTWVPTAWLQEQKVAPWSDLPVWIPGQGETAGFARYSIRRALDAGLTFRPLPTTAADTLAWWNAQTPERKAKMRAGLTPEREQQLLAEWKKSRA